MMLVVVASMPDAMLTPPGRPSEFRTPDQLRRYLKALNDYYAIVGRPRYEKSVIFSCIIVIWRWLLTLLLKDQGLKIQSFVAVFSSHVDDFWHNCRKTKVRKFKHLFLYSRHISMTIDTIAERPRVENSIMCSCILVTCRWLLTLLQKDQGLKIQSCVPVSSSHVDDYWHYCRKTKGWKFKHLFLYSRQMSMTIDTIAERPRVENSIMCSCIFVTCRWLLTLLQKDQGLKIQSCVPVSSSHVDDYWHYCRKTKGWKFKHLFLYYCHMAITINTIAERPRVENSSVCSCMTMPLTTP